MKFRPSTNLTLAVLIGLLALAGQWAAQVVAARLLQQTIQEREVDKANGMARIFSGLLELHADRARLAARLLAARNSTAAALGLQDQARRDALGARLQQDFSDAKVSTLEVIDDQEIVVYRAHEPAHHGDKALAWGVAEALAGSSQMVSSRHAEHGDHDPAHQSSASAAKVAPEQPENHAALLAIEPVRHEGAVVGAVAVGIDLDAALLQKMGTQLGAELVLLSNDGEIRTGPGALTMALDQTAMVEAFQKKVPVHRLNEETRHTTVYLPIMIVDEAYVLLARIDSDAAYELADVGKNRAFGFAAITVVISIALGLLALHLALAPLRRLRQHAQGLAHELTGATIEAQTKDEVASVVQVLSKLTDGLMQRNVELSKAKTAAEEASMAKTSFLSSMSHEIRTPLNGVLGMAELLQQTQLDAHQRRHVQAITSGGKMLHDLLSDVLDLAKIEAGQVQLEQVDFDLQALLSDIAAVYQELASARGLTLKLSCQGLTDPWLHGDPTRLRQVLTNLLGNALKFTQQGQIELTVQQLPAATGDTRSWWRMAVSDTGIGISEQARGKLFQKFVQAETSTTRQFGGTGLGLNICKQLVALMGGHIDVESQPGQGSRFWVDFPLAAAVTTQPTGSDPAASRRKVDARVLVAEDNAINQMVIRGMLESMGATVTIVDSGLAAVQQVQVAAFDLVFMDCQMPVMDGFDATKAIRAWEKDSGKLSALPIVALTANALAGDREACLAAGMDHYLSKPISLASLQSAFERLTPALMRAGGQAQPAAPVTQTPRAANESQPQVYDPSVLQSLPMVADGSDPDFAGQMIAMFIEGSNTALARIESAWGQQEDAQVLRMVHTLKSSAAQVGALALAAEAERVETALRQGSSTDQLALERLRQQFQMFEQAATAPAL